MFSGTAGYLMNAGHFRKNHVSSGDLNRGRRTESRVLFGHFLHNAKSENSFPCREFRGSANLESAHPNNNFALTKLNPCPKKNRGSANLDSARRNGGFARTKLKPSQKKIRGSANLESAHKITQYTIYIKRKILWTSAKNPSKNTMNGKAKSP